jgi:HYR domain
MKRLAMKRRLRASSPALIVVSLIALFVALAGIAAAPVAGVTAATGTLDMNTSLSLVSQLGCAPVGIATDCAARTVDGPFPGLGSVTGSYGYQMDLGTASCSSGLGKALAYPIRLEVAGKGAIDLAVSEATACIPLESVRVQTQAFTVTGGTGIYAGASGSGTLERALAEPRDDGSRHGLETWKGTLTVPGLEFDLIAPTFAGATSRKVVAPRHRKRVRVRYVVTATDAVDGPVPATCRPRSGTRFHIGRTQVRCSATDTSANAATASFRITVRRHR